MTFGPGRQVWERFGHNAIWIHDPDNASDDAYNYGLFDFQQENFLLRFVRGEMWYWMAGYPARQYVRQYERDNRSVWVQELELSSGAALELQRFLRWNAEPEHRFYHYDYYRDNCSTRVRDALDRVLEGSIRQQTAGLPTGTTYRFHTQRLTSNDALISTGLLLALGQGVDRPISAWEEMFLPLAMRDHVRRVTVPGPDGERLPLVRSERTLFDSSEPPPAATPPAWLHWYLAAGAAIGGSAWLLGRRARTRGGARFAFLVVVGGWGMVAGLGGLVLAGLWGLTDHAMAYCNENLLQFNPLALALIPAGFGAVRGGGTPRWATAAALAVAGLSILGLLLQAVPGLDQVNGSIIALALPAHLGIAVGVSRAVQAPRTLA
ncbi:MAG: DUF4105 domain-containing protein, partial [Gemmatimonadales bacterium]|nr:DUF4105 domain-containing protein [Gemmatimonadales bacterium]